MQTYKIAIVAGDGIGPEVVAGGIAIMDAAVGVAGQTISITLPIGVVSMESSLFSRERAPSAV